MHSAPRTARALGLTAVAALVVALVAPAAVAQQGVAANLLMESGGNAHQMTITAQGENLRMDMNAGSGDVTMIWLADSMLMVMHPQKMYMEFSKEMMDRMRGMMQNMPNMPDIEEDMEEQDFSEFTFERTGNTDTINGMSAFEVAMSGPDVDGDAMLWMTQDIEIGMFEVFAQMGDAMANMNMPMMNRGGDNPADTLQNYMSMARAQGLPEGRVIRVVNSAEGTTTTITLQSTETGPFDASKFAAPAGYTKQQMPMMQH